MLRYTLYTTEQFERDFLKLDYSLQKQIEMELEQLKVNPYVGKPLGYKFFREKRVRNYRIYYLIYEEEVVVFIVALSSKKDQQGAIDKIKSLIPAYKEEIKRRVKQ